MVIRSDFKPRYITPELGAWRGFLMKFFDAIKDFTRWQNFNVKENTSAVYQVDLKIFCLYLHNPEIEDVTLENVLKYLEEMRMMEWADNAFPRKCQALKNFFGFYKKQGYKVLDADLIPSPSWGHKLPRVAEEGNYQKLISSIPRNNVASNVRNMAMINLLWDTGARNGEICDLKVSELDLKEMKAVVKTKKNKGSRPFRELFWTPVTNDSLQRWLQARDIAIISNKRGKVVLPDPDLLFFGLSPYKPGNKIMNKEFSNILRRQSKVAGISTMNPHSFRHHMGHDIIEKGGSNSDVSNILGHTDLSSSYIYTMMTDKKLHNRYKQFKGLEMEIKK